MRNENASNSDVVSLWLIELVLLKAWLEADFSTIIQMYFNFEIERKQSAFSPLLIKLVIVDFNVGLSFQSPTQQMRSSTDGLKVKTNVFLKCHWSDADV